MAVTGIGLDLRLTDERCAGASAGALNSFLAALQGGSAGACGSKMARITLTSDARNECLRRGIPLPPEHTICVNSKCGRALGDMNKMQSLLELLR